VQEGWKNSKLADESTMNTFVGFGNGVTFESRAFSGIKDSIMVGIDSDSAQAVAPTAFEGLAATVALQIFDLHILRNSNRAEWLDVTTFVDELNAKGPLPQGVQLSVESSSGRGTAVFSSVPEAHTTR